MENRHNFCFRHQIENSSEVSERGWPIVFFILVSNARLKQ